MKTRTKIIWALPMLLIVGTILYILFDVQGYGLSIPWKMAEKPPEKLSKIIGFN